MRPIASQGWEAFRHPTDGRGRTTWRCPSNFDGHLDEATNRFNSHEVADSSQSTEAAARVIS